MISGKAPPCFVFGTWSCIEHLSKCIFSPKHFQTPLSKDKSIRSERQADGFEGCQCLCLRWEASDGSEQLSSRILVWAIPPCHIPTHTHTHLPRVSANIRHMLPQRACSQDAKINAERWREVWIFHTHIIKLNHRLAFLQNYLRWCQRGTEIWCIWRAKIRDQNVNNSKKRF